MITFETEEEFQEAVIQVIYDNLQLSVWLRGYPFVTGVGVGLSNKKDRSGYLLEAEDSVV